MVAGVDNSISDSGGNYGMPIKYCISYSRA